MSDQEQPIRIWYQGFTHPVANKIYVERLQAHLDAITGPEVTAVFNGISPPAMHLHTLEEFRCAARAIQNAIRAGRENYDAFVLGHFQDAGLDEIKAVLDMPVLGLGETTMLHACTLGRRFGLITIDPVFIPWHEDQILRYGLSHRSVGVEAMKTTPELYMRALAEEETYQDVLAQFREQAQLLVERGADVLIPAGGLPTLLLSRENGLRIDGAPMINGINVLVKSAETAVRLKRIDGLGISRRSTFALPSGGAVDEFLAHLAD